MSDNNDQRKLIAFLALIFIVLLAGCGFPLISGNGTGS